MHLFATALSEAHTRVFCVSSPKLTNKGGGEKQQTVSAHWMEHMREQTVLCSVSWD